MSPDEVLFIAVISAAVGPISWEAEVLTHSKALPPLLLSLKLLGSVLSKVSLQAFVQVVYLGRDSRE